MYHALTQNYTFEGIYYLDVRTDLPRVNASATRENFRWAITTWLANHADADDIIFIFTVGHGGGYNISDYNHRLPDAMEGGRYDVSGDEGNEVQESTFWTYCWRLDWLYDFRGDGEPPWDRLRNFDDDPYLEIDLDDDGPPYIELNETNFLTDVDGDDSADDIFLDPDRDDCCDVAIDADINLDSDGEETSKWDGFISGLDLNGNGDFNDWVGIDECIYFDTYDQYWDDELATDLNTLNYAKLIFVRVGCAEEGNESCFNGGLIDDISAPKRIIMTAANETYHCWADLDGDGFSEWSEAFIDALYGQKTHYDPVNHRVVDEGIPVDADWSNDGHVSMWEAWKYAWDNDDARLAGLETPWLDDNFNGLPTYRNEDDELDLYDGLFSMETYFGFDNLKSPDVDDDGDVDMNDIGIITKAFGSEPEDPNWNPLADLNNDDKVNMKDVGFAARHFGKYYQDPPSPVSTETILFTYPVWTVVRKGEAFSVNIVLFNVDNLWGWEFKLYWNNTILNCTGAEICVPDVWGENVFVVGPGVENDFNATHGRYWIGVVAIYPAPSFNGSMVVATLTFEARNVGSTILDMQETKLADNEVYAIPHTAIDGLVIVRKH